MVVEETFNGTMCKAKDCSLSDVCKRYSENPKRAFFMLKKDKGVDCKEFINVNV